MLGFLLCYEFEVKARLGQHDLDDLFEKAMQLPSGQVKVFENFASMCYAVKKLPANLNVRREDVGEDTYRDLFSLGDLKLWH